MFINTGMMRILDFDYIWNSLPAGNSGCCFVDFTDFDFIRRKLTGPDKQGTLEVFKAPKCLCQNITFCPDVAQKIQNVFNSREEIALDMSIVSLLVCCSVRHAAS